MKRTVMILLFGTVISALVASCLKIDNTEVPTREEELLNLDNYIKKLISEGNDVDTTEMGVYYVTFKEGIGNLAKTGDTLTVGYAGYFSDGYLFDTSVWHNSTDSTFTFVLGNPPMIKGWDDGMKVMKKNGKAQLIVPSDLAYGSAGAGIIPPYETLVFVIIMKDIKPSN